jgi:dihydroorotate dehydrogenase (NAD+) catalytic subunit
MATRQRGGLVHERLAFLHNPVDRSLHALTRPRTASKQNRLENSLADLTVELNRLKLRNPILVASGTFGYAKEATAFVDFTQLGGIIPKTVTALPREGNAPPRTVETSCGLLNSIGLDNDGIDTFIEKHVDYLLSLDCPIIANVAGHSTEEFVQLAERLNEFPQLAGVELNMSCPNVSGGVDFATNPEMTWQVVSAVREKCNLPIIAKLTPNVTDIVEIAAAAAEAGADAVTLINTLMGVAIDWCRRKPILGNVFGGLSGPAIKPVALRTVCQVAKAVDIPIIGVGGIQNLDDVMEFLVAGATAVQIGTASFYTPGLASRLPAELNELLDNEGVASVTDLVGTLQYPGAASATCSPDA